MHGVFASPPEPIASQADTWSQTSPAWGTLDGDRAGNRRQLAPVQRPDTGMTGRTLQLLACSAMPATVGKRNHIQAFCRRGATWLSATADFIGRFGDVEKAEEQCCRSLPRPGAYSRLGTPSCGALRSGALGGDSSAGIRTRNGGGRDRGKVNSSASAGHFFATQVGRARPVHSRRFDPLLFCGGRR